MPQKTATDLSQDFLAALALVGTAALIRAALVFLPVFPPPTSEMLVVHTARPLLDNAFYIVGFVAGAIFLLCFYPFARRYLQRIYVPYFARSDGDYHHFWLFVFALVVSAVITVDPGFWYVGPLVACLVSFAVVRRRHKLISRVISKALAEATEGSILVTVNGGQWNRTFLESLMGFSQDNYKRLRTLGFALGGALIAPVLVSHIVLLWRQPRMVLIDEAYLRGMCLGIYGAFTAVFLLVYAVVLLHRYLHLTKVAADRLDSLPTRTPS